MCLSLYAQSGSEKCVVWLLDFCLRKLPSNQTAIPVRPLTKVPVDSEKPSIAEVKLKLSILPELSEVAGLDHSTECLQRLSL